MADKRQQTLRFRLPAWLSSGPSPSSPDRQTPANTQPPKPSTPTRKPASTAAQKPPSKTPGRATQTSNSQPQASKPRASPSSPARANDRSEDTSQASAKSPTIGQKKSPPRDIAQSEDNRQASTGSPLISQKKSPPRAITQSEDNPQTSTGSPLVSSKKSQPRTITQSADNPQASPKSPLVSPKKSAPRAIPQSEDNTRASPLSRPVGLKRSSSRGTTHPLDIPQPSSPSGSAANSKVSSSSDSSELPSTSMEAEAPPSALNKKEPSLETRFPAQRSVSFDMNHQVIPTSESDSKDESTKEVKEIDAPASTKQTENQEPVGGKMMVKQNKAANPQPRDKTINCASHQHPNVFRGADTVLHKDIQDSISKFLHKNNGGDPEFSTDERSISVITLAGENRGASMQLSSESPNKEKPLHIQRSYKLKPDETAEGEESSKKTESNNQKTYEEEDQIAENYINSNIQAINNSIMFSSSISQGNPGVHLVRTSHLTNSNQTPEKKESLVTHKAEVNITPSQKLTYEPVVRRRCLRGLLLESSDSEPENPDKPRRHGCRVGCSQKNQSNNVDIL